MAARPQLAELEAQLLGPVVPEQHLAFLDRPLLTQAAVEAAQ